MGVHTFLTTAVFDRWLPALTDHKARAGVLARSRSATLGNPGDCAPVGEGVSEMRIPVGPGYRVYFTRRGTTIYFLLLGGDKSSQRRDIARARMMAQKLGGLTERTKR